MVLCLIVGCSKRSGRDKNVSFYRIPKVITRKGPRIEELSRRRRTGFISAISRDDLTDSILENDRICSRHFISGKPADLEDELNPDWLPTQNLGHSKVDSDRAIASLERFQRAASRSDHLEKLEAAQALVSLSFSSSEEQTKTVSTGVQTDLTRESYLLFELELGQLQEKVSTLEKSAVSMFTEANMLKDSDDNKKFIQFYTGLPNPKSLCTIFKFVTAACSWGQFLI